MKQVCILRLLPSFWAFRWLEDERVARRLERSVIAIQSLRSTFHTTSLQSCQFRNLCIMNNNIFLYLFHHQSYKLDSQNTVRYRALQRAIQFHSTLASCFSPLIFIITFSSDFLQVRDLMHENINQYIGMCVESPNVCIVSMFCSRGSLQVTDIKFKLSYVLFLYSDATFVNPTIIGWKLN